MADKAFGSVAGLTGNSGKEGKLIHERVASILPFSVAEKIADKPLRIRGLAMTAGLSRNFNLYTSEELAAFAGKLQAAPVYLEHVSVNDAVGKVTKTEWDGQNLLYEAEIYDEETAAKIRKGLIRHVSVGADYETLDVTAGGKVPHGLHNAEMSLVAVPGIPETNIQVLERLCESLAAGKQRFHLSAKMREILEPLGPEFLQCVFCGQPGEYLVSLCTSCGDNAQAAVDGAAHEQLEPEVPGEYFLGFVQDPNLFLAEHFRTVWLDHANGILAVMAKTRSDPAVERCQEILFLKSKWQPNTVADWLRIHPDYTVSAGDLGQSNGVENMQKEELKSLVKEALEEAGVVEAEWDTEYINNLPDDAFAYVEDGGEKDEQGKTVPRSLRHLPYKNAEGNLDADHVRNALARLDQTEISAEAKAQALKKLCAAAGELGIESAVCNLDKAAENLQAKLSEAEGKLTTAEGKLAEANNTVEKLKALVPGVDLLKDPPKLMPVSEALERLARLELPKMQERLSLGNQLQAQKVRKEIFEVKQKYGVA
jgi:hypothetical protein